MAIAQIMHKMHCKNKIKISSFDIKVSIREYFIEDFLEFNMSFVLCPVYKTIPITHFVFFNIAPI